MTLSETLILAHVLLRSHHSRRLRLAPVLPGLPLHEEQGQGAGAGERRSTELPCVTIQLPLYNEMYVADRLIDAVCQIDYPRELLEIQVLDDSTDETRERRRARRAALRRAGDRHQVPPPHRSHRLQGGRARGGAEGRARGEFIAIFDADFIPTADFLPRTIRYFARSEGRDGAGALGAHQPGLLAADEDPVDPARRPLRPRARRPQPRRAASSTSTAPPASGAATAIDDAGGWQHDTLTEDLDLSYRAQLRGWQFVFVPGPRSRRPKCRSR